MGEGDTTKADDSSDKLRECHSDKGGRAFQTIPRPRGHHKCVAPWLVLLASASSGHSAQSVSQRVSHSLTHTPFPPLPPSLPWAARRSVVLSYVGQTRKTKREREREGRERNLSGKNGRRKIPRTRGTRVSLAMKGENSDHTQCPPNYLTSDSVCPFPYSLSDPKRGVLIILNTYINLTAVHREIGRPQQTRIKRGNFYRTASFFAIFCRIRKTFFSLPPGHVD